MCMMDQDFAKEKENSFKCAVEALTYPEVFFFE